MKRLLMIVILLAITIAAMAQDFSEDFRLVYEACVELRDASVSGSTVQMRVAADKLKSANTKYFSLLRCIDGENLSLNEHFVFDHEFVDSLIVNRKVYSFAQGYAERGAKRGTSSKGGIYMKTCCVGARSSSSYSFNASKYQELAIVAERGGLVNMKVHDITNDIWYNDTDNLNTGMPTRKRAFSIPNGMARLEITVYNKSDCDISFVIISN